jgi:hypothetical protein
VLGGTLSYGGTAQSATNVGTYTITPSGYTNGLGYSLSYTDGSLAVSAAPLTITAADAAKTYDGLAYSGGNGVTYTGFVNSETAAVLGGTLSYGGTAQSATNVGTYTITPSGLTSTNYTISYVNGVLTINPVVSINTTTNKDVDTAVVSLTSIQDAVNGTQNTAGFGQMPVTMGPGSGSRFIDFFYLFRLLYDRTGQSIE